MDAGDDENGHLINKKIVHIPLSPSLSTVANEYGDDYIQGELHIPLSTQKPKALIVFAHGSGSGRDSPRNQYVAKVLNEKGFATLLSDLLTPAEQKSDIKSQKVMGRYPGIVLNKFNIHLLSERLVTVTRWVMDNLPTEAKDLPIAYFGSSTGAAASIEASVSNHHLLGKTYAIVSRGGRPDMAYSDSIKKVRAATMLIVGAKDSKDIVELNKKTLKQLKNARSKELAMIPNAGHLFDEAGAIERVADISMKWFDKTVKF
jgi:dienelactone hydrolase